MNRLVVLFLAAPTFSFGNPVSGYLVHPPHTMVAENVLVGITDQGAVVSGRYRFRVTPDASEHWRGPPYKIAINLPVPIPAGLKHFEDIESLVHPIITIRGTKYYPFNEV